MRIAVIGYSGAGKSTLARALGERYSVPVLHMDRVHWAPGWQERDRGEAHRLVHEFMENPDWVINDRTMEGQIGNIRLPERMPTAFVCNNDVAAANLVEHLQQEGFR